MATLLKSTKIELNGKSAVINERQSMFGSYENYFSVRIFDVTGTIQRNFDSFENANLFVCRFIDEKVEFADTIEFYKSYSIYRWNSELTDIAGLIK